jgi:hypothetical protein
MKSINTLKLKEISLLKNVDMVLFHLKQAKKESGPAKMASY